MHDLIAQVPTLLTATQIRDAMEAIGQELEAAGEVCRDAGATGFPSGCRAGVWANGAVVARCAETVLRLSQGVAGNTRLGGLPPAGHARPKSRPSAAWLPDSALESLLELELVYVSGAPNCRAGPSSIRHGQVSRICGIRSLEELPATDVLTPAQLNEWIRRAPNPRPVRNCFSDAVWGWLRLNPTKPPSLRWKLRPDF